MRTTKGFRMERTSSQQGNPFGPEVLESSPQQLGAVNRTVGAWHEVNVEQTSARGPDAGRAQKADVQDECRHREREERQAGIEEIPRAHTDQHGGAEYLARADDGHDRHVCRHGDAMTIPSMVRGLATLHDGVELDIHFGNGVDHRLDNGRIIESDGVGIHTHVRARIEAGRKLIEAPVLDGGNHPGRQLGQLSDRLLG